MKSLTISEFSTSERIRKIAARNYETYVAHYRSRKLEPMPLSEFIKNYAS